MSLIKAAAEVWGSSTSSFSLARELANGTSSIIVVPGNHTVAGEFDDKAGEPIQLTRNVTLTGAQGLDTVLDLAFLHGVVQLCATCVFTITNITMTNERRGPGGLVDLLVGQPSGTSIVRVQSAQRLRLACTSAASNMVVVVQTPRSKILPGPNAPQITGKGDVTWNGRVWPATLMNRNYTVDIPFTKEEGSHHLEGGYALDIANMRSLCKHEVSAACLAVKSPQACIDDLTEQELQAQTAAAAPGRPHPAAIAVPVVAAVLLVAAGIGFLLWRRHRQALQKKELAAAAALAASKPLSSCSSPPSSLHVATYSSNERDGSDVEKSGRHHHSRPCGSKQDGWITTHSVTCPSFEAIKDDSIQFGELLGAGSFGRVYRGRWNGMEVAVKVIEHDASSAVEVENEVLLMMGLQHECIVAAYHYVTYSRSNEARLPAVDDNTTIISDGSTVGRDSGQQLRSGSGHRSSNSGQTSKREAAAKKQKAESHLVMEFCDCGTLTNAVASLRQQQQQQQQQSDEVECQVLPQVLLLLHDVARGLQVIHSNNIVHADLNARNVLVRSNAAAAAGLTAKLADFGLSRAMKQHQTHRTTKTCGTMSHMPPEVLKEGRMSPAMDVYAFGVMMWEVATGSAAFKRLHYGGFYQAVVVAGQRPALPPGMPPDYAGLMQQCWAGAAAERPSADQLVEAVGALIAARESQQ
uniref:Protein kinase domain-containing protein n=1 Tax=Tetradesmus obliquus TaxID=3088 RepID=A0A383VBH1_TETOB|eukprot:jgi/Sobl393_1/5676/SZX62915.1